MNCLTITLNAAIDTTYVVERLEHGGVNRILRKHAMPGGKGNNVARVLAARGHVVTASGFLGGDTGTFIESSLREAGVKARFTWLESAVSRMLSYGTRTRNQRGNRNPRNRTQHHRARL